MIMPRSAAPQDSATTQSRRRLLALDGGGILGMITLKILKKMETDLKAHLGAEDTFRLSDYFDYIGGTSTGAIIAAGLATGMSVDDLITLYRDRSSEIFTKSRRFVFGLRYRYQDGPLRRILKGVLGDATIAELRESGALKSHLLVVARNATSGSAWLVNTNPHDPFAAPLGELKLWQAVRASTAAPFFFPPETITVSDRAGRADNRFIFEDGGVTAYNSPSLALFRLAVSASAWEGHGPSGAPASHPWASGSDRLLLVSVGTGEKKKLRRSMPPRGRRAWRTVREVPSDLMAAIATENDINCRLLGECAHGPSINLRHDDLREQLSGVDVSAQLKLFRYVRYTAELSPTGLRSIGLAEVDHNALDIDRIDMIPELEQIGDHTAEKEVNIAEHFGAFV